MMWTKPTLTITKPTITGKGDPNLTTNSSLHYLNNNGSKTNRPVVTRKIWITFFEYRDDISGDPTLWQLSS